MQLRRKENRGCILFLFFPIFNVDTLLISQSTDETLFFLYLLSAWQLNVWQISLISPNLEDYNVINIISDLAL